MRKYQRGFTNGLAEAFAAFMAICIIGGMVAGGLIVWLAPKVWDWIKPIIHSWTA